MYIHTYVASYLQHTYTNHTLIMKLYSLSNYHTIRGLKNYSDYSIGVY